MSAEQEIPAESLTKTSGRSRVEVLNTIRKIWPWIFLALMIIIFTIAAKTANDTNFLSIRSLQGILNYTTQILLLALGETLVIITAGIDLSTGYILGFSSVIAASVMEILNAMGVSPIISIPIGMIVGIIPGWINGVLVARVKVPAFISTLGMGYAIYGVALLISGGYPVANQPAGLGQLGNGSIFYLWINKGIAFLKIPKYAQSTDLANIYPLLPNIVFITLIVTAIVWFVLAKTQFGQHLYAIGGNLEAATRAGIPVKRTLIKVYIIAGIMAGVAGVLWTARFTSGAANAGETSTLMAIAAVVIGGASLFGGEGSIIGTVIGALIIATIQFGLVILGMQPFWQYIAVGVVVIIAVVVDQFGRSLT
jgi:ribose/xylose/arabinose/galactoside ABC-type transport system permease subunit